MPDLEPSLARATRHSPFLAAAIDRHPDLVAELRSGRLPAALALARVAGPVRRRLRRSRDRLALVTAIGDLSGAFDLEAVVTMLSDFADEALDAAIMAAIEDHVPGAQARGFVAVALGKHGSRELNYSSDIDPIFLYDPATLPRRAREEAADAAVRIARKVVDLLQRRDGDGYVFRVDLRLRPAAEITPIALSVDAAITHYESSALGWERAAFVRARSAAGDIALGERFLLAIRSFVWRRSLDFGTVGELRAMSRRIRSEQAGVDRPSAGFDLKRGPGGIREIEFFAQINQLIHGGRDPKLRVAATMPALEALATAERIDRKTAAAMASAYRLLRTIEHRLQMIDDRQTHALPPDERALDEVAHLHGLETGRELIALLQPEVERARACYDELDDVRHATLADDPQRLDTLLAVGGWRDPVRAAALVARWRANSLRVTRTPAAHQALEAVLPELIEAFGAAGDPDATLIKFDALLERLPSAINLFRLLDAQPPLRRILADVLMHAPVLAEALGANPALLDRLIDPGALLTSRGVADFAADMAVDSGTEPTLDRVRQIVAEERFALGIRIVKGNSQGLDAAVGYAKLAEAAIVTVAERIVEAFATKHGKVTGSELCVLALGRLGGGTMTHASDLDLVYLFTGDHRALSDGEKPLAASHYYNRLGQRLTAGLSVPTSAGALYQVDTRLRPSGAEGPLVTSVDSFSRYQREAAWTWEHMALTRARVVFGSAAARTQIGDVIAGVLGKARDDAVIARDIVGMRAEMARHKPPAGPLDVKLGAGGLVDLEFFVHFNQLTRGIALVPDLGLAIAALSKAGVCDPALGRAYTLLTRLLLGLRLMAPDLRMPAPETALLLAQSCGSASWDTLVAQVDAARHCVSRHWQAIVLSVEERR